MKRFIQALVVIAIFSTANAVTLVDTGEGGPFDSKALQANQWLAAEFFLDQAYILTDVKGWIRRTNSGENGLRVVIREDAGDIPGQILFSESLLAGSLGVVGWLGASGRNWELNPGYYWVAFEVDGTNTNTPFVGGMNYFGGSVRNSVSIH